MRRCRTCGRRSDTVVVVTVAVGARGYALSPACASCRRNGWARLAGPAVVRERLARDRREVRAALDRNGADAFDVPPAPREGDA